MGKHGNEANGQRENNRPYEPKHAGGRDGYEWAADNTDTVELPKVKKSNEKW